MAEPAQPSLLLPRPRSLRFTGGVGVVGEPRVVIDRSRTLVFPGDEAYRLKVDSGGCVIEARAGAGATHARRTLAQLERRYGTGMPALVIEDGPSFPVRGVMLDVSRDRVPTMEHLFRMVELLASLKINHLQLYTEHTFAYDGHEEVWEGWSPITPDEVRELDVFCAERGVELAANQNCFGHLTKWLTHERYAPLAETHGEWRFMEWPRSGPFSLCPVDPRSAALVEDLLGQLLPCFRSGLVNIGCDETFDVGAGRSKEAVEERGRPVVYAEFVSKIGEMARRRGKRAMFWADIALSHPETLELIPEEMIGLAWGYEADAPFGEWCARLRASGREAWVCPGTSSWRSITGRTSERRANIRGAAREGVAGGASGFLVTDWGDTGHHQQWPVSLAALAEAADAAWNADALDQYDARGASLHVFGDAGLRTGPWLDELGDSDADLRRVCGPMDGDGAARALRNASALFTDLHMALSERPGQDARLRRGLRATNADQWRAVLARLERLRETMPSGWPPPMEREVRHTLDVAILAAERGRLSRAGTVGRADRLRLASDLERIVQEHRRLWLLRSRPGGLEASCGHYARITDDLLEGC